MKANRFRRSWTVLDDSDDSRCPAARTKKTERFPSKVWSSLWTGKALSVTLSVVGVLLITEPWHDSGDGPRRSTRRMTHFRPLPRRLPRLDLAVRVPTGRRDLGHRRILGAGFSLFAALGTSIYQVYFKRVFGDTMKPEEAGVKELARKLVT
eukprot:g19379.t1